MHYVSVAEWIKTVSIATSKTDVSYCHHRLHSSGCCRVISCNMKLLKTLHYCANKYIKYNCRRFSVNLLHNATGNIALHFNARLDRGYVVRNTKFRGSWEEEETCSPAGHTAFRRNSYVHILIFCTANAFQARMDTSYTYQKYLTNLIIYGSEIFFLDCCKWRAFLCILI